MARERPLGPYYMRNLDEAVGRTVSREREAVA